MVSFPPPPAMALRPLELAWKVRLSAPSNSDPFAVACPSLSAIRPPSPRRIASPPWMPAMSAPPPRMTWFTPKPAESVSSPSEERALDSMVCATPVAASKRISPSSVRCALTPDASVTSSESAPAMTMSAPLPTMIVSASLPAVAALIARPVSGASARLISIVPAPPMTMLSPPKPPGRSRSIVSPPAPPMTRFDPGPVLMTSEASLNACVEDI